MRVSLCVIARNEASRIASCLKSVRAHVHEAVVVDTGSTDATREIASSCGAQVHEFAWRDDFSAARNDALRLASGEWIFWMDADDVVDAANQSKLATLLSRLGNENAGYIMQCASLAERGELRSSHAHVRVFPHRADILWEHRIHEQIAPSIERGGGSLIPTDVVIQHYGYATVQGIREKHLRNLRLSEIECEEHPTDAFAQFYRGWALAELGRHAEALIALNVSAGTLLPGTHGRKLHTLMARSYLHERAIRHARETLDAGLERYPDDLELLFAQAQVCAAGGEFARAEACVRRVLAKPLDPLEDCADASLVGSRGRYFLALVCVLQDKYSDAETEAEASLAAEPGYEPTWLVLADALAGQGRLQSLERMLGGEGVPPISRTLLRMSLRATRGDLAGAAQELEESQTSADPLLRRARQWLAEVVDGSRSRPRIVDLLRAGRTRAGVTHG